MRAHPKPFYVCYVLTSRQTGKSSLIVRCHPTVHPKPGHPGLREFEYRRHGTAVLLALLEVGRGRVFHHTVRKNGIEPFRALLEEVVDQPLEAPRLRRALAPVNAGVKFPRSPE